MSHSNQGTVVGQVESLQRRFAQAPGLPFADLLPTELIEKLLQEEGVEFRDRDYPPLLTLAMFLSQCADADSSLKQAVARRIAHRVVQGETPCSSNTGAYSKARHRLPEEVIANLTRHTGRQLMTEASADWRWHGRSVKIVDGATVSMPDTEANQREYPQPSVQKPGLGFPIVRFVVIFSLAVGAVLDAAFCPYKGKENSELALIRRLHDSLSDEDLVLADRYFCSFFEIAELQRRGIDVVMRLHQHRKTDFRRGVQLGRRDHLVWWQKPARPDWMDEATYRQYPAELVMRELRVQVKGRNRKVRSRTITIATTLYDHEEYRKIELAELYRLRWQAELNLRSLKSVMRMDVLRCKTPAMVRKEMWAHFLTYNLIRKVMCQAAEQFGLQPWTISFKGALQTMNAFALPLLTSTKGRLLETIEETHLDYLALQKTRVTDAGLKNLTELKHLRTLDLSRTGVTGAGLKELADLKTLQTLALEGTKATDKELKEIVRFQGLRFLNLSRTNIADGGLKDIGGLKNLDYLALNGTMVTDAGLTELVGLTNLKFLHLLDTKVTAAGVAKLRKALPKCEVLH